MNTESWIALTDYSSKHRISVSTLRRRIKADDIKYRFQDGKYFLMDTPMGAHPREHRPSLKSDASLMGTLLEASSGSGSASGNIGLASESLKQDVAAALLKKGNAVFNSHLQDSSDEPIFLAASVSLITFAFACNFSMVWSVFRYRARSGKCRRISSGVAYQR